MVLKSKDCGCAQFQTLDEACTYLFIICAPKYPVYRGRPAALVTDNLCPWRPWKGEEGARLQHHEGIESQHKEA